MRWSAIIASLSCVAGCFAPDPSPGLPCGPGDRCPNSLECDLVTRTCEDPAALLTWSVDSAADFATPTAVLEDAVVEPNGAIGPTPYVVEGVRIAGIVGEVIPPLADASWDSVASLPITGRGFWRSLDVGFGDDAPPGVGLDGMVDDVTVLVEGEIYFDAGDYEIELACDDQGFVEIAPPRSTQFQKLATASWSGGPTTVLFTAPVSGWYAIRGAVEDGNDGMTFEILVDDLAVPLSSIRARVDDLDGGFAVDGFDEPQLMMPTVSTFVGAPLDLDFGDDEPTGITGVGAAEFTIRFSGQVLVDADGDYTLALDTEGGHRWWIDGTLVADQMTDDPERSEVTTSLDRGWHDVVVDVMKDGGSDAHVTLSVESGPSLAGGPFPLDHTRPVIGRGARWLTDWSNGAQPIADAGSTTKTLSFEVPPDAVPHMVDIEWRVDHTDLPSIEVILEPPSGADIVLAAAGSMTGTMSHRDDFRLDPGLAASPWRLVADDVEIADLIAGTFAFARLSLTYAGGTPPFPLAYRYVSEIRDLGNVTGIRELRWGVRQLSAGSTVAVRIRTCDAPETCDAEPWTDAPSGEVPSVATRRHVQFEVAATTDGDVATAFDFFELDYRVAP